MKGGNEMGGEGGGARGKEIRSGMREGAARCQAAMLLRCNPAVPHNALRTAEPPHVNR